MTLWSKRLKFRKDVCPDWRWLKIQKIYVEVVVLTDKEENKIMDEMSPTAVYSPWYRLHGSLNNQHAWLNNGLIKREYKHHGY